MRELTQTKLKELLHHAPLTGVFTWLVPRQGTKGVGSVAGTTVNGYRRINIDGRLILAHRLAWLYVKGYLPENIINHKDRRRNNNQIKNLRETSHQCNARNTGNPSTNTSGVKGVSWHKAGKKWSAQIYIHGKKVHLGLHKDLLEAVCHRLAAEQGEDWSGCDASSPAFKFIKENIRNDI